MPLDICQSAIDWAATGSMLQGVGTVAGVGAVVWGAANAANVWKKQKQAERRLELAERILTATHKAQRSLAYVRSIMMWGNELSAAEAKLKDDPAWAQQRPEQQKRLTTAQAYFNRLNNTRDEQLALDECMPLARALFSARLEKAIESLRRQYWVIQVDAESYGDDDGSDRDFTKKIRRGMYDVSPRDGERNEVSEAITEAVRVIEESCMPALRLEPLNGKSASKG